MTALFERALPEYMAIGMSPDEFWNGDPALCAAYRESWRRRQENADRERWAMGAYVYQAVGSAVASVLSDKGESVPYLEAPFGETDGGDGDAREEKAGPTGFDYMMQFAAAKTAAIRRQRGHGESAADEDD